VIAHRAGHHEIIAGPEPRIGNGLFRNPNSCGIHDKAIELAFPHHFCVAGHKGKPKLGKDRGRRFQDPFQIRNGKAFLHDEGQSEGHGTGAHDTKVVHRPGYRELPDIPAGEEKGLHRVAIGGDHEFPGRKIHHRAVVELIQADGPGPAEGEFRENVLQNELLHHRPAGAVKGGNFLLGEPLHSLGLPE
jgi:hypothetical protein